MTSRWIVTAGLVAGVALVLAPGRLVAQEVTAPELKAAFLLNFIKFTTWPGEALPAAAPIVACVSGDNRIADGLEGLSAEQLIDGHPLAVRRLKRDGSLAGCHVLYWSATNDTQGSETLHAAFKKPILTVSDLPDFAEYGGVAGFFVVKGKMGFAVNLSAVDRAQLRISSRLLSLAKIVKDSTNASNR